MTLYAHSHPDTPDPAHWQPLEAHLRGVAERASAFAAEFASADWAWNAGWLHDIGKADKRFQAYLLRENGLDDSEYDETGGGRVNHSSAGAALAEENLATGHVLAYLAAGHHAGLPDWFESETGRAALRIRMEEGRANLARILVDADDCVRNLRPVGGPPPFVKKDHFRNQFHLWVRMIFSCLTDADSLDTEAFMNPAKARQRTPFPSLAELKARLDTHLAALAARSESTPVNVARQEVLAACRAAAQKPSGLF